MNSERVRKVLDFITIYGIYLLLLFLYTDKGQTFREIGFYLPILALSVRFILDKQIPINWKNYIFLLVVGFVLSAFVATFLSPVLLDSLARFKREHFKLLILFIVFFTVFKDKNLLYNLSKLMAILSIFFIFMTFYDFFTKAIQPDGSIDYGRYVRKYITPLEVLMPFIPMAILTSTRKIYKIFWIIILCSGLVTVFLTGSRGGWLSIIVSFSIWIGFYIYYNRQNYKDLAKLVCLIFVSVIIIVTLLPNSHIIYKIKQKFYTSQRIELVWPAAINIIRELPIEHKFFGAGLSRKLYQIKYIQWVEKKYNRTPSKEEVYSPHNFYLYTLYKQGIVGLIILLFLIIKSIQKIYKKIITENKLKIRLLGVAILSSFIGAFVVHGLFEDQSFLRVFTWLICLIGAYTNDDINISCSGKIT